MTLLGAVSERQYTALEFAGLPEGWGELLGLSLLAGLIYVVVLLYRREGRRGASRRMRVSLALIRCTVLAVLALIWLEPVVAQYTLQTTPARVLVLVDSSASMAIRDVGADAGVTRINQVESLLSRNDSSWLRRLAERNELALYTFGEHATRLPTALEESASKPASAPTLVCDALRTDLGQAVGAALEEVGDQPVAGVIVISDGAVNAGPTVEDVVGMARRAKTAVYAVGVGGDSAPANVRVTSLVAPTTAAKGDPIELRAGVSVEGIPSQQVRLELRRRPLQGGEETLVATADVPVDAQNGGEARFQVEAADAGQFLYRVASPIVPGEAIESDNQREAAVIVLDEQLRVLLVAGRPTFDYRYVSKLLERDKSIDVSCWLQSADARAIRDGDTVITELPTKPEDLFAYDAIILMDPNPQEFDSSWAINARRLADEFGAGLLLQAGAQYTSRFLRDPRLEEFNTCLPIVADADADVRLSEQGAYRTEPSTIEFSDEAIGHPLLSLSSDVSANRAIWKALPGAWWRLPVLREKPLATVLMRDASRVSGVGQGRAVLMATQPFGAGRTVFLGFDNTWRWRSTAERAFERFWIQVVRYLAQARREGASKRGTITVDREMIRVGDYLKIEARVLDARYVPWHAEEIEATIEMADGVSRALPMKAIPGREGWFAARALVDWAGGATIRVPLPDDNNPDTPAEALVKHVRAEQPDLELRSLRAQPDALTRLATGARGEFVPIANADSLPDRIKSASQTRAVEGPRAALWDRGYTLALLAALLGVEWALRRRSLLL